MAVSLADHLVEYWNALDGFTSDPTQSKNLTDSELEKILEKSRLSKNDTAAILRPLQTWSDTSGIVQTAKLPSLPPPANPLLPPLGLGPVQKPNLNAAQQQELEERRQRIFDSFMQGFNKNVDEFIGQENLAPNAGDGGLSFRIEDIQRFRTDFEQKKGPLVTLITQYEKILSKSEKDYGDALRSLIVDWILPSLRSQFFKYMTQKYIELQRTLNSYAVVKNNDFVITQSTLNGFIAVKKDTLGKQMVVKTYLMDDIVSKQPKTDLDFDAYWLSLTDPNAPLPEQLAPQIHKTARDIKATILRVSKAVMDSQYDKFYTNVYQPKLTEWTNDFNDLQKAVAKRVVVSTQNNDEKLSVLDACYRSYISSSMNGVASNKMDEISDDLTKWIDDFDAVSQKVTNTKPIGGKLNGIVTFLKSSLSFFPKNSINHTLLLAEQHWFEFLIPLNLSSTLETRIRQKDKSSNAAEKLLENLRQTLDGYMSNRPVILFQKSKIDGTTLKLQHEAMQYLLGDLRALMTTIDQIFYLDLVKSKFLRYASVPLLTTKTAPIPNNHALLNRALLKGQHLKHQQPNLPVATDGLADKLRQHFVDYYKDKIKPPPSAPFINHVMRPFALNDKDFILEMQRTSSNPDEYSLSFRGFWSGDDAGEEDPNTHTLTNTIYQKNVFFPVAIWHPQFDDQKNPVTVVDLDATTIQEPAILIKMIAVEDTSSFDSALSILNETIQQQQQSSPNKNFLSDWNIF